MTDINDRINKLEAEKKQAAAELAKITRLKEEFPDLETHTDRWKNVRYMASSANARVFQVEFRNSCGCCRDTPVIALPYLEFEGQRIYSNPCYLYVGSRTYDYDVQANAGWKKPYEEAGISHHAIAKIKNFLEASAARDEEESDADAAS
jgi:hypothetical protein